MGINSNQPISKKGSRAVRSTVMSTHSSVCALEEAKLCGLVECVAVLQNKYELEMTEALIDK